jgi:hypothetical protein
VNGWRKIKSKKQTQGPVKQTGAAPAAEEHKCGAAFCSLNGREAVTLLFIAKTNRRLKSEGPGANNQERLAQNRIAKQPEARSE